MCVCVCVCVCVSVQGRVGYSIHWSKVGRGERRKALEGNSSFVSLGGRARNIAHTPQLIHRGSTLVRERRGTRGDKGETA